MATTSKGIIYPTSSDNIAPLETHFANLATSVDTAISGYNSLAGGVTFTGGSTAGSTVTVSVTFPTGSFTTAPTSVVCTVSGTSTVSPYIVNIYSITSTGFTAKIYRVAGTTAETSLKLNYLAK